MAQLGGPGGVKSGAVGRAESEVAWRGEVIRTITDYATLLFSAKGAAACNESNLSRLAADFQALPNRSMGAVNHFRQEVNRSAKPSRMGQLAGRTPEAEKVFAALESYARGAATTADVVAAFETFFRKKGKSTHKLAAMLAGYTVMRAAAEREAAGGVAVVNHDDSSRDDDVVEPGARSAPEPGGGGNRLPLPPRGSVSMNDMSKREIPSGVDAIDGGVFGDGTVHDSAAISPQSPENARATQMWFLNALKGQAELLVNKYATVRASGDTLRSDLDEGLAAVNWDDTMGAYDGQPWRPAFDAWMRAELSALQSARDGGSALTQLIDNIEEKLATL